MAVQIELIIEQPQDSTSQTNTRNIRNKRVWLIRTNEPATRQWIKTHPLVVKPNMQDPDDPYAFVQSVSADRFKSGRVWKVTAIYTEQWIEIEDNPLNQPASIELDSIEHTEDTDRNYKGKRTVNTAAEVRRGQRIWANAVWKVRVNFASYPVKLVNYGLLGAVNADPFRIRGVPHDPKTLMVRRPRVGDFQRWGTIRYLPTTFELHHKHTTYIERDYSSGTVQLQDYEDPETGVKSEIQVPILVGRPGQQEPSAADSPEFLDLDGHHLPQPVEESDLVKLEWERQPPLKFRGVVRVV